MVKLIREDRRIEGLRNDLIKQAERLSRLASQKYTMWKETLKNVEVEKGYNKGFLKRVEQLTKEHQDNIVLYNNIRSQRNRFIKAVEVCIA
ncbi:hypothetical protein KC19_VG069100 [Ceratodon purpureus]|uniref:Uncharacterized protein n=1 Tax=Ceratodon purpureus TaxID=3225 RepID=A0A8T0HMR7_CERPU|nr:hypothetical protein KC19_VG069100 [Ceratodon purpureus]